MQAVSKPLLKYKRQGRVCTVFMDPVSNIPQSINSFEGDDTAFPMVMKEDEVWAKWGTRYQLVPIDPPNQGPPPEADAHIDESLLSKALDEGNKAAEAYRKQHGITTDGRQERLQALAGELQGTRFHPLGAYPGPALPQTIPPTPSMPQQDFVTNSLVNDAFRELETMFAKRSVASGKLKKELSAELNAICNFLLKLAPGWKDKLLELSARHTQQERVEF
jgi:hypothetical protein